MFCKKCGNEMKEGLRFCPMCGTPVKEKKDGKRKFLILICVLVALIIVAAAFVVGVLKWDVLQKKSDTSEYKVMSEKVSEEEAGTESENAESAEGTQEEEQAGETEPDSEKSVVYLEKRLIDYENCHLEYEYDEKGRMVKQICKEDSSDKIRCEEVYEYIDKE